MTWPTQPASTQHLDQPGDSVLASRQDIKQNVDNLNNILAVLNTDASTTNDVLVGTASNTFQNLPLSTIQNQMAVIKFDLSFVNDDSTGTSTANPSILIDSSGSVTVNQSTVQDSTLSRLVKVNRPGSYRCFLNQRIFVDNNDRFRLIYTLDDSTQLIAQSGAPDILYTGVRLWRGSLGGSFTVSNNFTVYLETDRLNDNTNPNIQFRDPYFYIMMV